MDQFEVVALVFGGLLILGALASGLAQRSFLAMTAVFVVAGFLLGDGALEVLEFEAESGFVVVLATVALIVILFRDGIEVEAEMLQREWRLPARKLVLAMPITCVLVAAVAHALTDLSWTESFLLGALLSPTDPVLSSSVVTNPRVPRLVRHRDDLLDPRPRPADRRGRANLQSRGARRLLLDHRPRADRHARERVGR